MKVSQEPLLHHFARARHARIQEFLSEGGGGYRPDSQKTAWARFFKLFLVLNLFYNIS